MSHHPREPPPTSEDGLHTADVGPASKGKGRRVCSQLTSRARGSNVCLAEGRSHPPGSFLPSPPTRQSPHLRLDLAEGTQGCRWLARHDGDPLCQQCLVAAS